VSRPGGEGGDQDGTRHEVWPGRPDGSGPGADAQRLLAGWVPPNRSQDRARGEFLAFVTEHGPQCVDRDLRVGHLTASTLLLDETRERVLLTLHPLADRWFQLGGHVEPGDATIAQAAAREAAEESGIDGIALASSPISLDRHPTRCRTSARVLGASMHWDIQHVAVAPAGAEPVRSQESLDLAWFPLDALPEGADAVVRGLISRARDLGHA
jgi:8-oxo-dGTP pyrophosphatase MutT (NUDIX family)